MFDTLMTLSFCIIQTKKLENYKNSIQEFLLGSLKLELHPDKCKIIPLNKGVSFIGFKIFYHHKKILRRNLLKINMRLNELIGEYQDKFSDAQDILRVLEGWNGYAKQGNTYALRKRLTAQLTKILTNSAISKPSTALLSPTTR